MHNHPRSSSKMSAKKPSHPQTPLRPTNPQFDGIQKAVKLWA